MVVVGYPAITILCYMYATTSYLKCYSTPLCMLLYTTNLLYACYCNQPSAPGITAGVSLRVIPERQVCRNIAASTTFAITSKPVGLQELYM
jgi:hypothetical protein